MESRARYQFRVPYGKTSRAYSIKYNSLEELRKWWDNHGRMLYRLFGRRMDLYKITLSRVEKYENEYKLMIENYGEFEETHKDSSLPFGNNISERRRHYNPKW